MMVCPHSKHILYSVCLSLHQSDFFQEPVSAIRALLSLMKKRDRKDTEPEPDARTESVYEYYELRTLYQLISLLYVLYSEKNSGAHVHVQEKIDLSMVESIAMRYKTVCTELKLEKEAFELR